MDWNELRDVTLSSTKASAIFRYKLENSTNPYEEAVKLFDEWSRYCRCKPKYPTIIMTELSSTVQQKRLNTSIFLTISLKLKALETALSLVQKNSQPFITSVCQVYCLKSDKEAFYTTVKSLVQQQRYAEACVCAAQLNLQDQFQLSEIVIPLFFQDKMNLVELYLNGKTESQVEFVKTLDSFCGDIALCQASRNAIKEVKVEKLIPKTISKLVARLIKLYNIPLESCPNLSYIRSKNALKYVLYKKYTEGLSDGNWVDLVMETVGTDKQLQRELILNLACYNDYKEVARWGNTFAIPKEDLPVDYSGSCKNDDESQGGKQDSTEGECWDSEPPQNDYLKLRLSLSYVKLVETSEDYHAALDDLQNYDCVGLDGEWKPCLGLQKSESKIALLQIATWDTVYLLDMLALEKCLTLASKTSLVDDLFLNSAIIKFGYGFTSDIDKIGEFIPTAKEKLKRAHNMVDFAVLYDKLRVHYPDLIAPTQQVTSPANSKTLTELTRTILGFPLDKSEQFSNWERRPLRSQQIIYAALDAFCLLQLYEVWYQRADDLGTDFNEIIETFHQGSHLSELKVPQGVHPKKLQQFPPVPTIYPPTKASDFKAVVDTMLQGLGKHLRICGIDTKILESRDHHDKAAKIAQDDHRVILTSGAPYHMLKQYVPDGMCFDVPCGMNAREQTEMILGHYNVQINTQDIFSRCSACNDEHYIHIPCSDMKNMWTSKQVSKQNSLTTAELRDYKSYPGGKVKVNIFRLESGAQIGMDKLTHRVFDTVEMFLVCYTCGKIYWEGSHHGRVLQKLESVLNKSKAATPGCSEAKASAKTENLSEKGANSSMKKVNYIPPEELSDNEWDASDGFYHAE